MPNAVTYPSREEWLKARRSGLGASEIAAILGEDPWDSPFAIWGDKTGRAPKPPVVSEAAEWGLNFEEPIARKFGVRSGRRVEVPPPFTVWTHPVHAWKRATPDAMQWPIVGEPFEGPGVLQVKTASERVAYSDNEEMSWRDGPPVKHQIQLQHEMDVTGCSWGSLICLVGGQELLGPYDYDVNDDFLADIHPLLEAFWNGVLQGIAPDVDAKEATTKALSRLYPDSTANVCTGDDGLSAILHRLEEVRAATKALGEEEDLLKNQAAALIGDASVVTLPNGDVWTYKTKFTREHVRRGVYSRVLRRKRGR